MKRFVTLCIFLLMFGFTHIHAQSPEVIKRQGSPWFWGEYESADREKARDKALTDLSSRIATTVVSEFRNVITETDSNAEEFMESIITTYTSFSFSGLQPLVERNAKGNHVYLFYIHKDDLENEFQQRRRLIFDMYANAEASRDSANLSRALQNYYYCLILMNSVPDRIIDYQGLNLRTTIPSRIQSILDNISFVYEGDVKPSESLRTVLLKLEYQGKPVQLLNFIYLERGTEYFNIARDGRASFDLAGASVTYSDIDVEIEYRFASERDINPLVAELWQGVTRPSFNNRRKISLETTVMPAAPKDLPSPVFSGKFNVFLTNQIDCPVKVDIKQELITFLDLVSEGEQVSINNAYKNDQFLRDKISSLFKYNRPQILDTDFHIQINETWNGWEVRNIPVACRYPTIATQTMEYLVLDFDNEGRFVDISFNVFDELFQHYVNDDRATKEEKAQKQVIVKFLEKYRTAFMTREITTLEQIFADEAIIIVGRILQPTDTRREYDFDGSLQRIEYSTLSKDAYLERQRLIFQRQRDIHLGFNTFKIQKKDHNTDIFGISMRQQYSSSGYADEGHLFLLVDFMEQDPVIYVRSWQPGEWSDEEMINMSDFRVLD